MRDAVPDARPDIGAQEPSDEDLFDDDLHEERLDEMLESTRPDNPLGLSSDADEATPGQPGLTPDLLPSTPNEDHGNLESPPADVDMQRTSDDNDLNPEGSGLEDTPLRAAYESMARRDDIARRVDELLIEVREWADEDGSDESRDILDSLEDLAERLGAPSEDSDT